MYLQFLSFLHTDIPKAVEIRPHVSQGPSLHSQYHGCRRPAEGRGQGIGNHDIDLVKPG